MARIEDYALIGDCKTAALVSRHGSIDWLCWPRFDSEACFTALLGDERHGRWQICPVDRHSVSRRYRHGTLILETEFVTSTGCAVVIDFMPLRGSGSDLVRLVVGKAGRVRMSTELIIRFGFGVHVPWVRRLDDGTLVAIAGPDMVSLRTPAALHGKGLTTVGEFTVTKDQRVPFVLTHTQSHLAEPEPIDASQQVHGREGLRQA